MKQFIVIFLATVFVLSCKSTKPAADSASQAAAETQTVALAGPTGLPAGQEKPFDYHQQTSWVLGWFDLSALKKEPHADWFEKGYEDYMPGSAAMNRLMDIPQDDLSVLVIMGTWCPDSRREVPRFMRIMDIWHFPPAKIKFIGVDMDKKSPVGDFEKYNIERVPTFIIYKNNIEAGRIIEVPKTSLEQDLINILQGMK